MAGVRRHEQKECLMREDPIVEIVLNVGHEVLRPPLSIESKASLLYQVTVDNFLKIGVDPKAPKRGQSAFQTDLCVFEEKSESIKIPRVVIEFKTGLSTHDIITYNAKAKRHKQIYPYLRYGLMIANESRVPGRFFNHNEAIDFCVALAEYKKNTLHETIATVLQKEVDASRLLELLTYSDAKVYSYRTDIKVEGLRRVV
jgi:hypothetical protein